MEGKKVIRATPSKADYTPEKEIHIENLEGVENPNNGTEEINQNGIELEFTREGDIEDEEMSADKLGIHR